MLTGDSTAESYDTTRKATSAALHGRIDYVNLQDPRVKVTVEEFSHHDSRYRFFS